ncbi:MAG: sigma-54 dependent transcriptional regulator [Bacteroidetes bacterium]|nr:sigma-54 dependent transcriptional regulator [Bacteroidota bacterium]
MENKVKILVIDDEEEMLNLSSRLLTAFGYEAIPVKDTEIALDLIRNNNYDLVLCDLLMPGVDGIQIIKAVKEYSYPTQIIIFSAYGTIDRAVNCMKAGAIDFLEKPFEADHLKIVVEKALEYKKLFVERDNLLKQLETKFQFENIIGRSNAMQKIFDTVESVADSEANILITGESGTGKELIARVIHARSGRKKEAFVPINCAAFPENLFEAEIFGSEKGAFTDATHRKIGLLEFADKGTFFFDEVCELPVNLQTKLLRVIQDRQLRRVGGNELIKVDIRLISATNKDPKVYLEKGLLRDDLYYRLNVINIDLPPLRKRKEDIILLADYFLKENNQRMKKNVNEISNEVVIALESYNWPGNVRELENVIERAVTFSKKEVITMEDLPPHLQSNSKTSPLFYGSSLKEAKQKALEDVEKRYLLNSLTLHEGNITRVSEEANMTRRNVYRLITRYEISLDAWR